MQQQPVAVGPVGEGGDGLRRVDRAELGALGDRDHARLHDVLVADAHEERLDELGSQPAVRRVDDEQLAPRALGSAALVDVQVRGARADDRLPGLRQRLQTEHIRASSVEHWKCLGIRSKMVAKALNGACGPGITTVGGGMSLVGGDDRRQHVGMDPGVVVTGEAGPFGHWSTPVRSGRLSAVSMA
jgi:hypothetical protein